MKDPEVFNRIKRDLRHIRPDCCPEAIYDHAIDCWSKDPDSRITFEYISHFFGDYEICTEHGYDEVDEVEEDDYMNQWLINFKYNCSVYISDEMISYFQNWYLHF